MTKQEVADTIAFCLEHGSMGGCDCFGYYAKEGRKIVKKDEFRSKCPNGRCNTGCVVTTLREALGYLRDTPELMNLDDLLNTCGSGWEESWFSAEDGDADEIVLEPCAWCHGYLILKSGNNSDLHDERVTRRYNHDGNGYRIWRGDRPSDEQRKAAKWE